MLLASDADMTMRAFAVDALKENGLIVTDDDGEVGECDRGKIGLMTNHILKNAIQKILKQQAQEAARKRQTEPYVRLYGDAKPSESIQPHELPGLGVAAIFVNGEEGSIIDVPINQYKEYDRTEKAARAKELAQWLKDRRKEKSLAIVGFMNALDREAAARLGLDLIEELPNTRIEKHYEKTYRLYFGEGEEEEHLDFAQAIALVYYMFTVTFAVQQVAFRIDDEHKAHMIAILDRFPDGSKGDFVPGGKAKTTQGMKFARFLKANAETFTEIDKVNEEEGIAYRPDTLEGWRYSDKEDWRDPKTHPNFVIVDWLVAAAIAHKFPEEFIAEYKSTKLGKKKKHAEDAAEELSKLYTEFKEGYGIWEIANANTLSRIVSNTKKWKVPEDAKQFIYDRAAG